LAEYQNSWPQGWTAKASKDPNRDLVMLNEAFGERKERRNEKYEMKSDASLSLRDGSDQNTKEVTNPYRRAIRP
jgi:hypothetical protein